MLERLGAASTMNGQSDTILRKIISGPRLDGILRQGLAGGLQGASRMLLDRFREVGPGRFFEGAVSDRRQSFSWSKCPGLAIRQGPLPKRYARSTLTY